MMGTGKSTVGRILAARLGRRLVDSDEQIERLTGLTVREIFEREGELAFRRFEAEALADALDDPEPAVVAAAGGVVVDPGNRALLAAAGTVVWLRAKPETLIDRVDSGDHRPLLHDDPLAVLRRLGDERADLYEEIADVVIDVDHVPPETVADRVMELVG